MKNILLFIGFVIAVVILGGLYLFRPVSAPTEMAPEESEALSLGEGSVLYRISSSNSSASFSVGEILNNAPFTAEGETTNVTGEIILDTSNPSASDLGTFSINARTFQTDSKNRDTAIARFILKSEDPGNEFITFTASSVTGLPGELVPDTEFELEIAGDLTIAGVTKPTTFTAMVSLSADGVLSGEAETTVMRGDFGLTIPNVPQVASVDEEVTLTFTFTANPEV